MKQIPAFALFALLFGCGESDSSKMSAVCQNAVRMVSPHQDLMQVSKVDVAISVPEVRNIRRFAELTGGKDLSGDQLAALEVNIKNRDRLKEAYVSVDIVDDRFRRPSICWFMDVGRGYQLASVSAFGRTYSGFSLLELFVERGRPKGLSDRDIVQ